MDELALQALESLAERGQSLNSGVYRLTAEVRARKGEVAELKDTLAAVRATIVRLANVGDQAQPGVGPLSLHGPQVEQLMAILDGGSKAVPAWWAHRPQGEESTPAPAHALLGDIDREALLTAMRALALSEDQWATLEKSTREPVTRALLAFARVALVGQARVLLESILEKTT